MNLGDVGMIERGERLRFAREPRDPFGVVGKRVGKDLQRDVAIEFRIARPIHLAHAACAKLAAALGQS